MPTAREAFLPHINEIRYQAQPAGYYESFFQRANHPSRPLAFWIRYTLFSPRHRPQDAVGELWAIFFNGETGNHVVVKHTVPLHRCTLRSSAFEIVIGEAHLRTNELRGSVSTEQASIAWDLACQTDAAPLFLLPLRFYGTRLPAAKSLVGVPLAAFQGNLIVNGETIEVNQWIGSQNHNWGSKHTDSYAWGQVAGFDTHPESFLEVATARLKTGPVWSPPLTLLVLRHAGKEWALHTLLQGWRAKGSFDVGHWHFRSQTQQVMIEGSIDAPHSAFVGLRYANPPGGTKDCLNTKLASCRLRVHQRESNTQETLFTRHRAAFEILTEDHRHGLPIRV